MSRKSITRKDAEKVVAAIKAQRSAWVEEGYGPHLLEDFDDQPFVIVWEEGPYQWTYDFPFGGVDEEFGTTIKDVSAMLPDHLYVEAMTSYSVAPFLR